MSALHLRDARRSSRDAPLERERRVHDRHKRRHAALLRKLTPAADARGLGANVEEDDEERERADKADRALIVGSGLGDRLEKLEARVGGHAVAHAELDDVARHERLRRAELVETRLAEALVPEQRGVCLRLPAALARAALNPFSPEFRAATMLQRRFHTFRSVRATRETAAVRATSSASSHRRRSPSAASIGTSRRRSTRHRWRRAACSATCASQLRSEYLRIRRARVHARARNA